MSDFFSKLSTPYYVAGAAILSISVGLVWLGVFRKVRITEQIFPGGTFFWIDFRGHIKDIQKPYI